MKKRIRKNTQEKGKSTENDVENRRSMKKRKRYET